MTRNNVLEPPDPMTLRQTMGRFATGVAVITTRGEDGEPHGMTVNSLTSVSLAPPLLLVCFAAGSRTSSAISENGRFGVNILSERQLGVSRAFSRQGENHFADVPLEEGPLDVPLIRNAVAQVVCTVSKQIEAGDHVIVLGEIANVYHREGKPLCFFSGKYGEFRDIGEVADFWYF